MRVARRALFAVLLCVLSGCSRPNHYGEWIGESDDAEGLVLRYDVYGSGSGEPITVVLLRFQRGAAGQPVFRWESTSGPNGYEVRLGNRVLTQADTLRLFVNGPDGTVREVPVEAAELRRLFRSGAVPTREQLVEFWDRHVQPSL